MKRILVILLSMLNIAAFAQLSAVDYNSKDFAQFKASKTFVVQSGDPVFDGEVEKAMKESWKITSFDFISGKEFEKKVSDPSASFIVLIVIGDQQTYGQNYHYLALVNGGKKKITSYSYEEMLAYAPINHWGGEWEMTDCGFRVRNMIESMIQAMDLVQKNDIHGNTKKIVDKLQLVYNEHAKDIKKRTLLVCEDEIGGEIKGHKPKLLTKAEFAGLYPFKFEFVSKARLTEVINSRSKDYYYLQLASTLNKSIFVFDPSNGEVVYFEYKIMGLTLKDSDVKDLVMQMNGK